MRTQFKRWLEKAERQSLFLTIDQLAEMPFGQPIPVIEVDYLYFMMIEDYFPKEKDYRSISRVFRDHASYLTRFSEIQGKEVEFFDCCLVKEVKPYLRIAFQGYDELEPEYQDIFAFSKDRQLTVGGGDRFTRFVLWQDFFRPHEHIPLVSEIPREG